MGIIMNMKQKKYEKDSDIQNLIKYIAGKGRNKKREKVFYVGSKGISKEPAKATEQVINMQKILGKNEGRRVYHMIISFPENVSNLSVVKAAGKAVAETIYEEGYLVYYGIHTSTDNLHIHFAIGAVNYLSGKKWHRNKMEFAAFKGKVVGCVQKKLEENGYGGVGFI